jgi:hypothetical protein
MELKILLIACLALSGCGTLEKTFANRVSCSLDRQEGFVNSMYGPVGVTSKVAKEDAAVMCKP